MGNQNILGTQLRVSRIDYVCCLLENEDRTTKVTERNVSPNGHRFPQGIKDNKGNLESNQLIPTSYLTKNILSSRFPFNHPTDEFIVIEMTGQVWD